jgi:hypothetical protein
MGLYEDLLSSPLLQGMQAIAEGEKALPDSEAKRHHFIPEFLLRRFSVEKNGQERLCQLDVHTGKPLWVDPARLPRAGGSTRSPTRKAVATT